MLRHPRRKRHNKGRDTSHDGKEGKINYLARSSVVVLLPISSHRQDLLENGGCPHNAKGTPHSGCPPQQRYRQDAITNRLLDGFKSNERGQAHESNWHDGLSRKEDDCAIVGGCHGQTNRMIESFPKGTSDGYILHIFQHTKQQQQQR